MKKLIVLLTTCFLLSVYPAFSQNVGIGILNPTRSKLELNGSVGATSAIFGGESTGISLQSNWPGIGFNQYHNNGHKYMANGYAAVQYLDPGNGYMALDLFGYGTANTVGSNPIRAFTIANNGNIGIGTGPTNASLYAIKGTNEDGSAIFGGTLYNSHFQYSVTEDTYIRGGKIGSKVFINDISGGKILMGNGNSYVGINNGVPVYPLEVRQVNGKGLRLVEPNNSFNNWELRLIGYSPDNPNSNLNMVYNGQHKGYFTWGTGIYEVYSDKRLKTEIANMQPVLRKFMQLEPVTYEMKNHNPGNEKIFGFIAQDVKKLFPELVVVTTDISRGYSGINDLHGLNYNGFTVLVVKAMQEQQELIKNMKQLNKELAMRIEMAELMVKSEK